MSINDVIDKNDGIAKKANASDSDKIFNRLMALFGALVCFIIFELCAHNTNANLLAMYDASKVLAVVCAVLAVCFFALSFVCKNHKVLGTGKTFSARFIACAFAVLSCFLAFSFSVSDSSALIILAFTAVALAFVGYTFSRDFFLLSLVTVASIVLSLWPRLFVYNAGVFRDLANYASVAAAFVICAAFCALTLVAYYGKNAKLSRWFFNYGCVRVYPLYFLPAIAFCTSVVRLFAPAMFSYALIVSVIAYVVFLVMYAFDSAK